MKWLLFILLLCAGPAFAAETIEDRCVSDGDCTVAVYEPLNGNDRSSCTAGTFNPTGGSSAQTMTIDTAGTVCTENANGVGGTNPPDTALPGRTYVQRFQNASVFLTPEELTYTGVQRVCLVHYEYHEGDWRTGGGGGQEPCYIDNENSWRTKFHGYHWGASGAANQWQLTGGNSGGATPDPNCGEFGFSVNSSLTGASGQASTMLVSEMNSSGGDQWVRIESCVWTSDSDLTSGDNISTNYRMRGLTDDTNEVGGEQSGLSDPVGPDGMWDSGFTWFKTYDGGGTRDRYVSTAAVLFYSSDLDQWPGPDCDIEPTATECAAAGSASLSGGSISGGSLQ